jgi:hypothetical protein
MRSTTVLAAVVLGGLAAGAAGGLALSSASAADTPASPSVSATTSTSTSTSAATSPTASASPAVSSSPSVSGSLSTSSGQAVTPKAVADDSPSASASASATASPSASPSTSTSTPPATWSVALTAPGVHALATLRLKGTVTAATGDKARPASIAIERRTGHTWHLLSNVALHWKTAHATFSYATTKTSRPGTYAFRARLTPEAGVTVVRTASPVVRAVIDFAGSGPLHRSDLPFTYRAGCPVGPSSLRRVTMNYWSFDTGTIQRGTMIVNSYTVSDVRRAFTKMFAAHFPIHKMYPVDRYHGKDVRAMANDDTSAFNCRSVTGNPYRTSQHSYGNAIDINTWENPYVTSGRVYPSHAFLRRTPYRKGMILKYRVVQQAFASDGWLWGARWGHPDYQHFSSNGG